MDADIIKNYKKTYFIPVTLPSVPERSEHSQLLDPQATLCLPDCPKLLYESSFWPLPWLRSTTRYSPHLIGLTS